MPQTISFETGLRRFFVLFYYMGSPACLRCQRPASPFPELFLRFAVSVLLA